MIPAPSFLPVRGATEGLLSMQVLLINASEALAAGAAEAIHALGGATVSADSYGDALRIATTRHIDAVIAADPANGSASGETDLASLGDVLSQKGIALLTVGGSPPSVPVERRVWIGSIDPGITADELRGRLATIATYHSVVKDLECELRSLDVLSTRLKQHFHDVDQELQLASRLQRDFLPDPAVTLPNVRFAAAYRPASWVSGDMYDVYRVDERRVGYYLADAVGHGTAAGLLTMFIKQAVATKHVLGETYRVLSPSETLQGLNDALVNQGLPNCRFVTACCGVLDTETMTLSYARGGHPYPIHISRDGKLKSLESEGGLLGLTADAAYPTETVQLQPGEKVILYSDGVETAFNTGVEGGIDTTAYLPVFESVAHLPADEMIAELERQMNIEQGSIAPRDDVTILVIEITEQ